MLVVFNGLVFAGVQFAIAIMGMAEPESAAAAMRRSGSSNSTVRCG
jgi:hypothetical protein